MHGCEHSAGRRPGEPLRVAAFGMVSTHAFVSSTEAKHIIKALGLMNILAILIFQEVTS